MNLNKKAIKNFAIEARTNLLRDIEKKLNYLKPATPDELPVKVDKGVETEDVSFNSGEKKEQRKKLIERYNQIGKDNLIKEVAYTWFNRFIAIRFMEVNGFLESNVKVFSATEEEKAEPQIVTEALNVDLPVDKELVYRYKDENNTDELFKYLLILQCDQLSESLPFLFEKLNDYTRLLLPNNLLGKSSVINKLVNDIPEDNFKHVEIIGWLYQYYVSERKDNLINAKKKYKTEDIPPVTQLFTPDWIVRYMTQNSLGRYWVESHPEFKKELVTEWDFYIENRDKESKEKIKKLENKDLNIEDVKILDPAMGSGHILVYAFDLLYKIYELLGYQKSKIPFLILENNLYGLDIDKRATQLAKFSVLMKARQYDNNLLEKDLSLNLAEIKDSKNFHKEEIEALEAGDDKYKQKIEEFIKQFEDAKDLGSIIKVEDFDIEFLDDALNNAKESGSLFSTKAYEKFKDLLKQYKILNQEYDVTIANPPYMGSRYMNDTLKEYVKEYYPDVKKDLFAVFVKMMFGITSPNGYLGIMSPYVWMYIKSYEKLRKFIIANKTIYNLVKPSYTSFFESAIVPICSYIIRNNPVDITGEYFDLGYLGKSEDQPKLFKEAINDPNVYYRYTANTKDFSKIPGSPIAYWVSENILRVFIEHTSLGVINDISNGMFTCNNKFFLRSWFEINIEKVGFDLKSNFESIDSEYKWFPYNKGGNFQKWYGNQDHVINFRDGGTEVRKYRYKKGQSKTLPGEDFFFKEGITYSAISSSSFGVRYSPRGFLFDIAGSSIFP